MSLIAIKNHMRKVKLTTLNNLCLLFNRDAETLRAMLSHWIKKGNIRQCTRTPKCGTQCFKCPVAQVEMYEWIESDLSLL
jgi:putative ferrous iron transport protein C